MQCINILLIPERCATEHQHLRLRDVLVCEKHSVLRDSTKALRTMHLTLFICCATGKC